MHIGRKIRLSHLDVGLRLFITDDIPSLYKKLVKQGYSDLNVDEEYEAGKAGYCDVKGVMTFYCIIELDKKWKTTLKNLAHEIFHSTQDILEYKGIDFKKHDPNEIYAYTYEYLFSSAYEITKKAWESKYGTRKETTGDDRLQQGHSSETH